MISVVVCTYNRAAVLERMLDSFFAQAGADECSHELIVVDNNSADDTREVAARFERFEGFRYVFEQRQGLSVARNRGVAEASGEIVAFLDVDVIVDKGWLRNLQGCFDESGAEAVGGRSYLVFEREPPTWLTAELRISLSEVDLGRERKTVEGGQRLYGLNMAFRKATLERVGGFDEQLGRRGKGLLGGEETVVFGRIAEQGGKIVYEPGAVVGHIVDKERTSWDYFKRLCLGLGMTWARSETKAGLMLRARRVAESVRDVLVDGGKWARAALGRAADDERRKVVLHFLYMWGVLRQRFRNLWRSSR